MLVLLYFDVRIGSLVLRGKLARAKIACSGQEPTLGEAPRQINVTCKSDIYLRILTNLPPPYGGTQKIRVIFSTQKRTQKKFPQYGGFRSRVTLSHNKQGVIFEPNDSGKKIF